MSPQAKYLPLYTKYRPSEFSEVVGQSHVIKVLEAIIAKKRVFHAFLFSGSHGTGKTSVARIFACALNSQKSAQSVSECAKNTAKNFDIIEIDAASHSGVEEIRQLLQNINNLPINSPYKIYIIDEIHMLSKSAFNALLKNVEEPPEYAIFIFATTEVNKVPLTLLSRVQRHNFVKLSTSQIKERLEFIVEKEEVLAEEGTLEFISRYSKGSLRDAVTLLEQLISYCGNKQITKKGTSEILGLVSTQELVGFFNACAAKEKKTLVEMLGELIHSASSYENFFTSLLLGLRDYLSFQINPESSKSRLEIFLPQDIHAVNLEINDAFYLLEILLETVKLLGDTLIAQKVFELKLLEFVATPSVRGAKIETKIVEAAPAKLEENLSFDSVPHSFKEIAQPKTIQRKPVVQERKGVVSVEELPTLGLDPAWASNLETVQETKEVKPQHYSSSFASPRPSPKSLHSETVALDLPPPTAQKTPVVTEKMPEVVEKSSEVFGEGSLQAKKKRKQDSSLDLPKVAFHSSEVQDTLKKWQEVERKNQDDGEINLQFEDFTLREEVKPILVHSQEKEASSNLTQEEVVNLLLQINIDDKKYLEEHRSRLSLLPTHLEQVNRTYYLLLKGLKVLRATRVFLILGSDNPLTLEQLNRVRQKPSFIRFTYLLFRKPLYLFGVSSENLQMAQEYLTELKRQNVTFRIKPLKPLSLPEEE